MATTIEEVQRIDEIKCLGSGTIEVLKGTYYIKTTTETVPVLDDDGNDTGTTEEQTTVTEDRISNWRMAIGLHDTAMAESVLEDSAEVATSHWKKFPVPEPVEVDLPPAVE